ncbi:hypothetical protein NDU88_004973 [Pleurodeles waltl]|uniref:Uncharacterized protein n=1 Tax=Pleurodeles waltl TaxID=8319 RepID=A0AAV7W6I4_PLEWA|nr:hypothetical protein NDU88_004973 [Pleurodeles waltl]
MLHKVQQWGVENMTLVQTGLMEVGTQGECMLDEVTLEEVQLVEGLGSGQVSGVFRKTGSDYGVPGCGKALALGGQEEHVSKAGQGRPAFISGHTVGVSTPLRHQQEETVRPGAAHPRSGESLALSQVWKSGMDDEPSTSQCASGFNWDVGFEETLDFDDDNERGMGGAGLVDVGGQGNNQSWSYDVLQGQKRVAVRSDRRVGDRIASGSAGNLPRGEERGSMFEREGGGWGERSIGARVRVQDMGIQTVNDNNVVETSKVGVSEPCARCVRMLLSPERRVANPLLLHRDHAPPCSSLVSSSCIRRQPSAVSLSGKGYAQMLFPLVKTLKTGK